MPHAHSLKSPPTKVPADTEAQPNGPRTPFDEIFSDAYRAAITTADLKDTEARLTQRIDAGEEQLNERIEQKAAE